MQKNHNNRFSTCLVVGAGGFIGYNLCLDLAPQCDKLYACDTHFSENILKKLKQSNIEIIEGGIEAFILSIEDYRDVEYIYYFAGKSTPSLLEAELDRGYFSDQEFLVMLLESCSQLKNLVSFVYGSSGGTVYGSSTRLPCRETQSTKPISAYGLSKLLQETYIQFYARRFGFSAKIARISNPYGRVLTHGSKQLQGFIDTSIDKVVNNETIEIWGDGEIIRDYIHITDLVKGVLALAEKSTPQGVYNLGSGRGLSLNDILSIYQQLKIKYQVKYIEARQIDVPVNILDIEKVLQATSWQPDIAIETGIKGIMEKRLQSQIE